LSLRDGLLDAVDSLLDERPWAKISMGEIASRAGVSRQTLYNEFGGRAEFAEALLIREAERLLAGPEREISAHPDDPRAAIEGALRTFLKEAAHNRLVESMTTEPEGGLLALVTTQGNVVAAAAERLALHIERVWPGVDPRAARRLTETVVRLGISHATLPTGSPGATARSLAEVLGPHLDELVPSKSSRAA
jgi:AcrR family transcriptional regulator